VRALEAERLPYPKVIEGYTTGVYYYMKLADFFIGKPGPGSISEALLMRLPVIIERNAWTLPQERYNAEWVRERGVGFVLNSFRNIHQTVDQLLEPATLAGVQANIAAFDNRAVFEIPEILERLLSS